MTLTRTHWLRRNGLAIAYTFVLILLAVGAWRVEDTRRDDQERVERALIVGCQSGNRLRGALRDFLDAVVAGSDRSRPGYQRGVELFQRFKDGPFADRDCPDIIDHPDEEPQP
jgi:hypothetical protein